MRNFRDILYDKNDIVVAIIILIIAAIIIYFRIGAIMDYPETLVNATADTTSETAETSKASDTKASPSTDASEATKDTKAKEATSDTKATDTKSYVNIKITNGDSSYSIATKLKKAGLIKSASAFDKAIKKNKVEKYLQTGTFKIPKNADTKEILNLISNNRVK